MASFALTFKGSNHLKQKLILATISGKAIKITDIRIGEGGTGIQEFEINAIRLIDKLTNETHIKISSSGTELEFTPGILHGGKIEHGLGWRRLQVSHGGWQIGYLSPPVPTNADNRMVPRQNVRPLLGRPTPDQPLTTFFLDL